jgi:hypothetical protein
MARRNLLAEAQVTAAAQTAPQIAALSEALQQSRADRNFAISAAATAYHGLSGAIHRAGPQVKGIYSDAAKGAAGTDAIARPAIAGNPTIAAAYGHEASVGGGVLAKAMASRLADLSDKRIAAAAGRAYSVTKATSDYAAAAATNLNKRQNVAAQQGLLTGANLSKLTEAQAGRDLQQSLTNQKLASQATLQSQRLASQESVAGARLRSSDHRAALSRRQQKLGRIDQGKRQDKQIAAADRRAGAQVGGLRPTATQVFKGRDQILAVKNQYQSGIAAGKKLHEIAADGRTHGVHEQYLGAGADLATKGYITPPNVKRLNDLGVPVPKEWQGVPVKPHLRKPRGK